MPLGDFVEAGTIPRPLPIGRVARLVFGAGALFYFIWNITQYSDRVGSEIPEVGYWVGVGIAYWYFSDLVDVGFSRSWGRWPQAAIIPLAAALVVAGLVAYENAWDLPLSWGVFILVEIFFGFIALSFLLAGTLAVPG